MRIQRGKEYWATLETYARLLERRAKAPKDKANEYSRAWRERNPSKVREMKDSWNKRNPNYQRKFAGKRLEWTKAKRKSDEMFALKLRMRARLHGFIKKSGYKKDCSTRDLIGCSWDDLKLHLERQFKGRMSWENRRRWHIDHIIPLASANSQEEVKRLCHYTNLRPMWAADNLAKGDSEITHQMALL